jgi:uncharacterized iron-regulated membrane protein
MRAKTMTTLTGNLPNTAALRRSLLWRVHFWAALIASPFALMAALTGIFYVFTPQIESTLHGHLDSVTPAGAHLPLDDMVQAARNAAPRGWLLHSLSPAYTPTDSARFAYMPPMGANPAASSGGGHNHGGEKAAVVTSPNPADAKPAEFLRPNFGFPGKAMVVYINPYTAEVLGSLQQEDRFREWSRKLHSNYLQGDNWRWMIELAASWLMVMLVTGIVLWWPRANQPALPQKAARGRVAWKQWHAFLGVALSLMSVVILTTGLTWSKLAGGQIKWARDVSNQAPPRIPANLAKSTVAGNPMLAWEAALQAIRREAPDVSMQIVPPKGPTGVWRANQLDRGQPDKRFDLLLDAYSGQRLYFSGWDAQTMFGKATAIGIPFHRGEFGIWNQALLLVFGLGVVFSIVSGWVMYFKRRAHGLAGLPRLAPGAWKSVSPVAVVATLCMLVSMPLLAISGAVVAAIESVLWWRTRAAAV